MTARIWLFALAFAGCGSEEYYEEPEPTPVPHDDHAIVREDSVYELKPRDLLANDEHATSYGTKVTIIDKPAHGVWSESGYLPDPGYFGPDQFTYRISRSSYSPLPEITATVYVLVQSDGVGYESAMLLDDSAAQDLAVAELTGDGLADLVVAEPSTSTIAILVNRTTEPGDYVVEPFRFEGGHEPVSVTVADLDRDGQLDIVTASRHDGLVVLRNITVAGGPLAFAEPLYLASDDAVAVEAVDIDGDGMPDLASLDRYARRLDVRINASAAGTLAFGVRTSFAIPPEPIGLVAADADQDGALDLAVLTKQSGALSLFVNATSVGATAAAFEARIDRATATDPRVLFLADLDGDAREELVVGHAQPSLWVYANQTAGDATPSYEAARVLELPDVDHMFAGPVDLDGQGPVDILVAASGDSPFTQLVNATATPRAYEFAARDGEIADVATRDRVSYGEPTALVSVELDGVAPPEIVVTSRSYSGGGVYVVFGD